MCVRQHRYLPTYQAYQHIDSIDWHILAIFPDAFCSLILQTATTGPSERIMRIHVYILRASYNTFWNRLLPAYSTTLRPCCVYHLTYIAIVTATKQTTECRFFAGSCGCVGR